MGRAQTTAFKDDESAAIEVQIKNMAKYHIRAVMQDFTLDDCLQLAVERGDRKIVREILPLIKHKLDTQTVGLRLPSGDALGGGIPDYTDAVSIRMSYQVSWAGAFVCPIYADLDSRGNSSGTLVQDDAPAAVRERLVSLTRQVLKIGADYAQVLAVFQYLNERYPKDREYVRYLFPGVLPLLRRCALPACKNWALKLVNTKAIWRDHPPTREQQAAIDFADEVVATGVLIGERPPHKREPGIVRLSYLFPNLVRHPMWDRNAIDPLLKY